MKNEETSRETPRDNAKVRMQKACHSAIGGLPELGQGSASGGKHSAFCIPATGGSACGWLHSAFLSAFTLLEVMIAVALFGLVMAGTIEVYIICNKLWHATSLSMETSRTASLAIQRMVYGLETNCGLRSAATISFANAHGHTIYPFPDAYKYWETGAKPPAASDVNYYTCTGTVSGAYAPDGSWRLIISNNYDGVKYIDYNIKTRSMLFWPDISSKSTRILVCNYVSAATATVYNVDGTVEIQLTVWKKDGMFVSSNQVSTFVKIRNKF